jgi:hypothetical protein
VYLSEESLVKEILVNKIKFPPVEGVVGLGNPVPLYPVVGKKGRAL